MAPATPDKSKSVQLSEQFSIYTKEQPKLDHNCGRYKNFYNILKADMSCTCGVQHTLEVTVVAKFVLWYFDIVATYTH